jgi:hypothetical protein
MLFAGRIGSDEGRLYNPLSPPPLLFFPRLIHTLSVSKTKSADTTPHEVCRLFFLESLHTIAMCSAPPSLSPKWNS